MSPDRNKKSDNDLEYKDAIILPEMDSEIRNHNIKWFRRLSFYLLLTAIFILVDCLMFIVFGFYIAAFSLGAAILAFVLAGKYAFYADALERGEFVAPSVGHFILKSDWLKKILLGYDRSTTNV